MIKNFLYFPIPISPLRDILCLSGLEMLSHHIFVHIRAIRIEPDDHSSVFSRGYAQKDFLLRDIPSYVEEEELPEDAVMETAPEEGPEDGTLEARELETVNPESIRDDSVDIRPHVYDRAAVRAFGDAYLPFVPLIRIYAQGQRGGLQARGHRHGRALFRGDRRGGGRPSGRGGRALWQCGGGLRGSAVFSASEGTLVPSSRPISSR